MAAPVTAVLHARTGTRCLWSRIRKTQSGAPVLARRSAGKVARQQFVRVGPARGDFVALLDGVKAGQELVTSGAFKLRNGSVCRRHNEVQSAFR
jgi:membrane fusion protein (multidrug efflux system)